MLDLEAPDHSKSENGNLDWARAVYSDRSISVDYISHRLGMCVGWKIQSQRSGSVISESVHLINGFLLAI